MEVCRTKIWQNSQKIKRPKVNFFSGSKEKKVNKILRKLSFKETHKY